MSQHNQTHGIQGSGVSCEETGTVGAQSTPLSAPTGPWFVCDDHPDHCTFRISETEDDSSLFTREVATVYRYGEVHAPRFLANARLIAAAPDLLVLARKYASECSGCDGAGTWTRVTNIAGPAVRLPCEDCADIRATIAKAEGRS